MMNYLGTGDEPGFDSAPCALCSEPITTYIGVFEPTRTFAKRIGEPKANTAPCSTGSATVASSGPIYPKRSKAASSGHLRSAGSAF
jgi:hypothetical protein